jgi:excinuclease UvrABC nuclease subunit
MKKSAEAMEFETAAQIRDQIKKIRQQLDDEVLKTRAKSKVRKQTSN